MSQIIPIPKIPITVRVATLDDLPFIDALQKKHSKQLGFFPRAQMEGYLRNQWVLVAEENGSPIGYIASRDRYQKRDELGAIFQLCVNDQARRKLVGAMLLKSVFERAPYGCKLFCCWCAQDIAANKFWEAMGFVPLAFRTGSRSKGAKGTPRVHLFWQKRICAEDTTTPWWFPSQTSSGAIREDRLVLPIPPGVRWDEAMPVVLPREEDRVSESGKRRLPGSTRNAKPDTRTPIKKDITIGGLRFDARVETTTEIALPAKREREPKQKIKNDPMLIAAARELRDRWLEQVNAGEYLLESQGKYEVSRAIEQGVAYQIEPAPVPKALAA